MSLSECLFGVYSVQNMNSDVWVNPCVRPGLLVAHVTMHAGLNKSSCTMSLHVPPLTHTISGPISLKFTHSEFTDFVEPVHTVSYTFVPWYSLR